MPEFHVRPLTAADKPAVEAQLLDRWGSTQMVSRGNLMDIPEHPGFGAFDGDALIGVLTYEIRGDEMEITFVESVTPGAGLGSSLMSKAIETAKAQGCRRIWLITTNDNLHALGFYQRRGFTLKAVYPNALVESRKIKPQISEIGANRIPVRDEIELEYLL